MSVLVKIKQIRGTAEPHRLHGGDAAAARKFFDHPKVLDDPIALPILGAKAEKRLRREWRLKRLGRSDACYFTGRTDGLRVPGILGRLKGAQV